VGEWYLSAFTTDAIESHMESSWDPNTKQISSTSDAWVQNTHALDSELNYTEFPTETQHTYEFDIPKLRQSAESTPPLVRIMIPFPHFIPTILK
jgi:hypothetical protein